MARKTAAMVCVDAVSEAAVLDFKYEAIADMQRIATSLGSCVRSDIIEYFGESPAARHRSVAVRLAEWLLSRSTRIRQSRYCCDRCDGVNDANVLAWAAGVFAEER